MSTDSGRERAAGDPGAAEVAAGEEDVLRYVALMGLSLAPKAAPGSNPPASHKLAFKLRAITNFGAVTMDVLLLLYLVLLFSRRIKPPVSDAARRLMWAALAATYVTLAIGVSMTLFA